MSHTPTPWKAYTQKDGWNIHGPNCFIAQVIFDPILLEETCETHRENARHIVHCVNVHDQLVAALRQISEGNVMGEMGDKPYTHADVVHAYTRIATKALAAAEKGVES